MKTIEENQKIIPGMTRVSLQTTPGQRKRGIGMVYAHVAKEYVKSVDAAPMFRLVYRWGGAVNPKFAAECKIDGHRTSLHRFVLGLHGKNGAGKFVVPRDGDALHCWPENLEVLTKDELTERRAANAKQRGTLTTQQQAWLNEECKRLGKSRWQVMGMLIEKELAASLAPVVEDARTASTEWD